MEPPIPAEKNGKATPLTLSGSSSSSRSGSIKSEHALPLREDDGGHHLRNHSPSTPQDDTLTIVSFEPNDPANPHNWSTRTKSFIFFTAFLSTTTTSFSSTLPSNFSPPLPVAFSVPDPSGPQRVLPASLYLAGFVFGPLVWAPLSEAPAFGRRRVLLAGAVLFVLASLAQAVVSGWAAFLALRFLAGVVGAPPVSVFGGVLADVFPDEVVRGRIMMLWSTTTFVGPLVGPILAGFASTKLGWRATFWIALSLPVASLIATALMRETMASKILRRKAVKLNKENRNTGRRFVAQTDLQRENAWAAYRTTLSRPWRLLFCELVVSLSSAYMGFVYAVFYMLLQIFSRIFEGVYEFSPGMSGILFTLIGLGTIISCFIFHWYDGVAPRLTAQHPTKREEYLRLPLVCAGGPLFTLSMLWLGWFARPDIHWLVPLASMIPYGVAYNLIYVGIINYVTDAYGVYSASAHAALSITRSVAGALLPLAIEDMLGALGIAWSCTALAGVSAGLALVPFAFIAYGERIRAGSRLSAALKPNGGGGEQGEGPARVAAGLSAV